MALPGAIQDVARRLPAAAARLAGVPGSGGPLEPAEAEQVAQMLDTLLSALPEGDRGANRTADALLSEDSLRVPMLHLVAFAVRRSIHNDPPAYFGVATHALFICLELLEEPAPSHRRAKALVAFARKLLRMDTLKCCSCAFSSAAARLAALSGAGGGAAAGVPGAAAATDAELAAYAALVFRLIRLATQTDVAERLAHVQRQLEEWRQLQQQFAGELAAALCDSHVLEHAARLALHVQLAESAGRLPQGAAAGRLAVVIASHMVAVRMLTVLPARFMGEALSGPCLRHAFLSLGVAALCAADGGPSHGLPPELLLRLPLLGPVLEPVTRGAPGKQPLAGNVFIGMMQLLGGSDAAAAAAAPPFDRRTVAALLHRIGRFTVSSARAWAEEGAAVGGAEPEPELTQLLLDEADIMPVAAWVLLRLRRLSSAAQAAPAANAATLAEAEAARWRLAVEVATHCMRWALPAHVTSLANLLEVAWRPPNPQWLLAPAAPLEIAAALAGGLLPLWERLLRCAGRAPGCAEDVLLTRIMASPDVHGVFWDLLAFGDPRQGAALVATVGKLLRTLAVPQVLWSLTQGGALDPACRSRTALAHTLGDLAVALLSVVVDRLKVAGLAGPDGSESSAPQLQLARLASLAACEWLPPLARLARIGLPALNSSVIACEAAASNCVALGSAAVTTWVQLLAQLCSAGPEATAEVTGGPAAGSSAAAAGWRQLLLREFGAVEILGTICQRYLRVVVASNSTSICNSSGISRDVLECCSRLAAACPGEVRRAVLTAAAEAAAAPGSGGGRGRLGGSGAGDRQRRAGRAGEAGPSRAMALGPPPGWSPQLFRALEAGLRGCPGGEGEALGDAAAALARQAEEWAAGGAEDGAELARAAGVQLDPDLAAHALRACSPAAARALLRTCSNPACDNLAGDSEAGLQLRACGRCGAAWYCRRECLAFHWRSGHKEACVERGGPTAAEAGPGQSAA